VAFESRGALLPWQPRARGRGHVAVCPSVLLVHIAGRVAERRRNEPAVLERVIPGWFGKLLIVVLLAFGAVDPGVDPDVLRRKRLGNTSRTTRSRGWQNGYQYLLPRRGRSLRKQLPAEVQEHTADGLWKSPQRWSR